VPGRDPAYRTGGIAAGLLLLGTAAAAGFHDLADIRRRTRPAATANVAV
jgi:hypothetical protein